MQREKQESPDNPFPKARVWPKHLGVWTGVHVSGPYLPTPLPGLRLSHSIQTLSLYTSATVTETVSLLCSPSALGPPSFNPSFTPLSPTEFSHHSGVLAGCWSARVHLSLGHCLLVFLLPPCLCGPFRLHRVCSRVPFL